MQTVYPDADNIQSTANPLSSRSTLCIQFTPTRVHHNTRSLYPLVNSSKTQLALLIANECCVHLWSDVRLYTAMEMARRLKH